VLRTSLYSGNSHLEQKILVSNTCVASIPNYMRVGWSCKWILNYRVSRNTLVYVFSITRSYDVSKCTRKFKITMSQRRKFVITISFQRQVKKKSQNSRNQGPTADCVECGDFFLKNDYRTQRPNSQTTYYSENKVFSLSYS